MGIVEGAIGALAGTIGEAGAGAVVSGAGLMSGGAAANAIMGGPKLAPPGGGIPGLTTSKGAGKYGDEGSAVQVVPDTALDYFKKAAESYEKYAQQGLSYYEGSMQKAVSAVQKGYLEANSTLKPLSMASNQALNQQLRMLGLTPISATATYADRFAAGYGSDRAYNDITNQMRQAEKIQDPAQRAAAKQQLLDQAKTLATAKATDYSSITAPKMLSLEEYKALKPGDPIPGFPDNARAGQFNLSSYDAYAKYMTEGPMADYKNAMANADAQNKARNELNLKVSDSINQWANDYTDKFDAGFTGDEITAQLRSTPGYKWQYQQGQEALLAKAAANGGMINSGNLDTALINYGQNQADSYYDRYMSNLAQVQQEGAAATGQIATNQANEGLNLGSMYQDIGKTGLGVYQNIGTAYNNAYTNSAQTWTQIMLANMQAQNAAISQMKAQKSNQQQSAMGAATSLAPLAMQQSNSYQQAQGYLNNSNPYSGGGGYTSGGWVAPGYTGPTTGGGYSQGGMIFNV